MTWEIGIATGGLIVITAGFIFPIIRKTGELNQKIKDIDKTIIDHSVFIKQLNGEVADIKTMLARVDANTINIKESVEKLEAIK